MKIDVRASCPTPLQLHGLQRASCDAGHGGSMTTKDSAIGLRKPAGIGIGVCARPNKDRRGAGVRVKPC